MLLLRLILTSTFPFVNTVRDEKIQTLKKTISPLPNYWSFIPPLSGHLELLKKLTRFHVWPNYFCLILKQLLFWTDPKCCVTTTFKLTFPPFERKIRKQQLKENINFFILLPLHCPFNHFPDKKQQQKLFLSNWF